VTRPAAVILLAAAVTFAGQSTEARMTPQVFEARAWLQRQVHTGNWRWSHRLWANESGWRVRAGHPSGSYGVPQASPGRKMRAAGRDWRTSAMTQVRWGLRRIRLVYGTPCHALRFQTTRGWW